MSNLVKKDFSTSLAKSSVAPTEQFLSIRVSEHYFGIPVIKIVDVVKPTELTPIPLAKPEISGLMNLRGRIVTVIDMRKRLDIDSSVEPKKPMFVVVEDENDIYSLVVDEVGQAITLNLMNFDKVPENLPSHLRDISKGIFQLEKELMLVLDVKSIVNF